MITGTRTFDFSLNCSYTLNPTANGPGSISPDTPQSISYECDPSVPFTMTPRSGGTYGEYLQSLLVYSEYVIPPPLYYDVEPRGGIAPGEVVDVIATFNVDPPYAIYAKLSWIGSGRYIQLIIDGVTLVIDFGEINLVYETSGFYGTPLGYVNEPPSSPRMSFPIVGVDGYLRGGYLKIPYGRQNSIGTSYYGYIIVSRDVVGNLSLYVKKEFTGSGGSFYSRQTLNLANESTIYNYETGYMYDITYTAPKGFYGIGYAYWLY